MPSHGRTDSSSGGFDDERQPEAKHRKTAGDTMTVSRLKEENDELQAKLRCLRDTVTSLDTQLAAQAKEYRGNKQLWVQREEELSKEIERVSAENEALRAGQGSHKRELSELKHSYDAIFKLHALEETKAKRNDKIIHELQSQLEVYKPKCKTPSSAKQETELDSVGGMLSAREPETAAASVSGDEELRKPHTARSKKSSAATTPKTKTPHVKSMVSQAQSTVYNPLNNFFA